jgi:hypothetical protein
VSAFAGLNAGLLVAAEHHIGATQRPALPAAGVQIEYASGLFAKPRIAGINPRFVLPGLDRVALQNPANGAATDGATEVGFGPSPEVIKRLPTEGQAGLSDSFAGDGLDPGVIERGKKRACGPVRFDR